MAKQGFYAPLLKNWIYPLPQRVQGRDFHGTMDAAVKNQFLSSDELQDIQFRKAAAPIIRVYKTVIGNIRIVTWFNILQ